MNKNQKTEYAPSERASKEVLQNQAVIFSKNSIIQEMANSIPNLLLILNKERQIVYANKNFLGLLNIEQIDEVLGQRPGEAVNCIHSKGTGGCGTTKFCSKCGAVNAILESHKDIRSVKECRIMTEDRDALDFLVVASPYHVNYELFTIFVLSDISDEKRRQTLERVFFHDVLNTAGGISGITEILPYVENQDEQKELLEIVKTSSSSLIDEIKSQRQLSAAERGELQLECSEVSSLEILKEIANIYSRHSVIENRKIEFSDAQDATFKTDKTLLRRALGNMLKNALEASQPDGVVSLSCIKEKGTLVFSVQNSTFIETDVQLQLFKRSFSTKGNGRGIGTYSIKLFGEKFLKGKVWFESDKEKGTTFYLEIPLQCNS